MDWKNHPVIVALVSGAAAMSFYAKVLEPIQTKDKDNTIAELNQQIGGLNQQVQSLNAKVSAEQATSASATKLSNDLLSRNELLSQAGMFAVGDPYPKGMSFFRLNDPISVNALRSSYPLCTLDDSEAGYVSVDCKNLKEFFSGATYYFETKSPKKQALEQILFHYGKIGKEAQDVVVKQMQLSLGAASLIDDGHVASRSWIAKSFKGQRLEISPIGLLITRPSPYYN